MQRLDYVPGLAAFLAVLIGLAGSSNWDSTREGLHRLTPTGWITLGLGAAALVAGQVLTWRAHTASDFQARQHKNLRAVADAEIRLALHQITGPFFVLFGDDSEETLLQVVPAHDPNRLASVMRIDVRSANTSLSGSSYDLPWAEVLKGNADLGAARIDRAMQIYATYLDPQVLEVLSKMRTSEFLVLRLQRLDERVKDNAHVKFLEFPFAAPPDMVDRFGFGQFWSIMRELDNLLVKDTVRLERRL